MKAGNRLTISGDWDALLLVIRSRPPAFIFTLIFALVSAQIKAKIKVMTKGNASKSPSLPCPPSTARSPQVGEGWISEICGLNP
jgi:hypothetical protein